MRKAEADDKEKVSLILRFITALIFTPGWHRYDDDCLHIVDMNLASRLEANILRCLVHRVPGIPSIGTLVMFTMESMFGVNNE